jgi:DNA-binding MarR family transcriptional regulator
MSNRIPVLSGRRRPTNVVVLLREAFVALNDLVLPRLAEHGHTDVRPAHGAVFQYLDDSGTTVSTLAERAQMTKQAMGELVAHLETHGYVVRVPDPQDRRAKLVQPTERGREVFDIAQSLAPEIERRISRLIGARRLKELRTDLETIRAAFVGDEQAPQPTPR